LRTKQISSRKKRKLFLKRFVRRKTLKKRPKPSNKSFSTG